MQSHKPARQPSRTRRQTPRTGLLYWARRAFEELSKAADGFQPDPVHDLRVAIRRCRSMAEGLRTIDPGSGWKQFRALPKPLFSTLGELRDTQVLQNWAMSLTTAADPMRGALLLKLAAREAAEKLSAQEAIRTFHAKRWLKLAMELDERARRLRLGSRIFRHLALERWMQAHALHEIAVASQDSVDLHQLRIGIKRFRYTVENFLPDLHRRWGKDLKRVQDLLGEVHDLDVLLSEVKQIPEGPGAERLVARIRLERERRISEYMSRTCGSDSLWDTWRAGLPAGRELSATTDAKLRHWSRALDRDPAHSRRVARTSLQLLRGLRRAFHWPFDRRASVLLRAAALFHSVGERKPLKKGQSFHAKVMARFSVPVGWTEPEMSLVRLVSRYCRGPVPSVADPEFSSLSLDARRQVLRMAGMVRLADALNSGSGEIPAVDVACERGIVTVFAAGFDPLGPRALEMAGACYLLELSEEIPVRVRTAAKVLRAAAHGTY